MRVFESFVSIQTAHSQLSMEFGTDMLIDTKNSQNLCVIVDSSSLNSFEAKSESRITDGKMEGERNCVGDIYFKKLRI